MKLLYKIQITTVLLFSVFFASAQNAIQYDQYMYNKMQYNPAYAGCTEGLSGSLLHSSQWMGFEGAPQTQVVLIQTPLKLKSIGLGLSITRQSIGVKRQTEIGGAYSYAIRMGNGYLSLGVSGSAILLDENLSELTTAHFGDSYYSDDFKAVMFNAGTGIFYYTNKLYLGVSSPKLLYNELQYKTKGSNYSFDPLKNPYYLTAGYVFRSGDFKLKPATLVKHHLGTPMAIDINFNALYNDIFGVGLFYRINTAMGMMVEFNIAKKYRVAYAYNASTKALKTYNSGSHEIMFSFLLPHAKTSYQSPRYF